VKTLLNYSHYNCFGECMKNVLIIGLIIFLFSISSAAFIEELEVLVIDSNDRSMEEVAVWTNYQINSIKGYVTTNKQYTNQYGIVNLKLINNEFQEKLTKTEYTLFLEYMGQQQSHILDAKSGRRSRTFSFDINRATIRVYDIYKGGIKSNVTILDQTRETSNTGYAVFNLPDGDYQIVVDHSGSKQVFPFEMKGDTLVEIPLTEFDISILLLDDKGNPLNGTVKLIGETHSVLNGKKTLKITAIPPILIEGFSGSKEVSKEFDPKITNEVVLPIDINPPEITGVTYKKNIRGYELSVSILDTGIYATGLDTQINPPLIIYSMTTAGEKTPERTLNLLPSGSDRFTITLTDISEDSVIDYEIWASDLSSNTASYTDTFLAGSEQQGPTIPMPIPDTKPEQSELELGEVFKWILIGLGVVVLILIVYAVIKLKSEMKEEK